MAATRADVGTAPTGERLARVAEQILRLAGDGRVGAGLLIAVGLANAVAAFLPGRARILEGLPYAVLLGAVARSGVAAVALRAPPAWREPEVAGGSMGGAWGRVLLAAAVLVLLALAATRLWPSREGGLPGPAADSAASVAVLVGAGLRRVRTDPDGTDRYEHPGPPAQASGNSPVPSP